MLDFTSALYLGLHHPSHGLQPWAALTQGRPALLAEPPGATAAATQLARLQGCEVGLLMPSTLHAFWDLFHWLGRQPIDVLMEENTYPIVRWGTLAAMGSGARFFHFARHDLLAATRLVARACASGRRAVIVVDGFSPGAINLRPLPQYAALARNAGGYLVVDDTQALGILGTRKNGQAYGQGGGGSLRWYDTFGPHIIVGASLAKAFGTPVAVLAGSKAVIAGIRDDGPSRVHCSPPSQAVIAATQRALDFNRSYGDQWRNRLAALTRRLREQLRLIGLQPVGALPFPAQSFLAPSAITVSRLIQLLARNGIRALQTLSAQQYRLTFLLTARHRASDIDHVCTVLARKLPNLSEAS